MVSNATALGLLLILGWLCWLLWRLYAEDERERTLARLARACEQTYAMDPAEPGLKFSWIMRRAKVRYPRVGYEQLGEEIKAAMWAVGQGPGNGG